MVLLPLQEMDVLNLKEQYNKFYSSEDVDDTASLVQFLNDVVIKKTMANCEQALELGVGLKSALFDSRLRDQINEISLLDFSETAIAKLAERYPQATLYQINVGVEDLGVEYFDLIIDAHCFHCIVDEEQRKMAFRSVYDALKPNGIFCGQMMIGKGDRVLSTSRFTPEARELEEEILKSGLSLEYFVIVSDLHYELLDKTKVELVRFIARK